MNISAKRSSASQKFLIACLAAFGLMLAVGVGSASAKLEFTLEYNFSGDQTPGTSFGNDGPSAIDVNPDTGEVYVVDPNHNVVPIFDRDGVYLRQIKGLKGEASVPTEWSPSSIAIDKSGGANNGYIYVTDIKGDVVQVFDPNGAHAGTLKGLNTPDKSFVNPGGVAVDKDGALYISDTGHQAIVKYVPTGGVVDETDFALRFSDPEHCRQPGEARRRRGRSHPRRQRANSARPGSSSKTGGPTGPWTSRPTTRGTSWSRPSTTSRSPTTRPRRDESRNPGRRDDDRGQRNQRPGLRGHRRLQRVAVIERRDLADGVTGGATEIKNTTAKLAASIDRDEGGPITGCAFEFGTDTSYGKSVACDQATPYSAQVTAVTGSSPACCRAPSTTTGSPRPTKTAPATARTRPSRPKSRP